MLTVQQLDYNVPVEYYANTANLIILVIRLATEIYLDPHNFVPSEYHYYYTHRCPECTLNSF